MAESSRSFTLMISGKRWRIVFVDPSELPTDHHMGDCDIVSRRIRIALGMSEQETKETIIHEILHASVWDLDEEAVVRASNAQARALTKANFVNHALLQGGKQHGRNRNTNKPKEPGKN